MSRYRCLPWSSAGWSPAARPPLLSAFSVGAGRTRKVGLAHALVVLVFAVELEQEQLETVDSRMKDCPMRWNESTPVVVVAAAVEVDGDCGRVSAVVVAAGFDCELSDYSRVVV